MWILIGIAVVALVSFAIFVLSARVSHNRDIERERLARERPTGQFIDPNPFN
jgi:hypothetical protein